jgi:transcription antitermination factor NusG
VGQHLEVRQIEHFLPLYRTHRKWSDGSRVTLDLPLFPGYIFVCIQRAQRVRVLEVPGVLAFVDGTGANRYRYQRTRLTHCGPVFLCATPNPTLF